MDVGRIFRPAPIGLVLSTIHGVTFVPHAWFVPVTSCTASRAPEPWPESRIPKLFCRPPSAMPALNQPKKSPLDPPDAVSANVPEALRRSFKVLTGIESAYDACV